MWEIKGQTWMLRRVVVSRVLGVGFVDFTFYCGAEKTLRGRCSVAGTREGGGEAGKRTLREWRLGRRAERAQPIDGLLHFSHADFPGWEERGCGLGQQDEAGAGCDWDEASVQYGSA